MSGHIQTLRIKREQKDGSKRPALPPIRPKYCKAKYGENQL